MRIILFTLLCIWLCQSSARADDDQGQFCKAWAMDAMQATEKRLQGVDPVKLMGLIDSIPDELLPPEAKLRAQSAVGFAYTYPMDMTEMHDIAEIRCMSCINESDPVPCMRKFDAALSQTNEIQF